MTDISEAGVIADLARAGVPLEPLDTGEIYSLTIPAAAQHQVVDLEKYLPAPRRVKGIYTVTDLESFVAYVTAHRDDEHTTVWVDPNSYKVVALLNDHAPRDPAWGDHVVELQLQLTPEWRHWQEHDGKLLTQDEFAEHVEDGLLEIVSPPAADLLEIVQTIKGATNASWNSSKRLSNGETQFGYSEEVTAKAGGAGDMVIPAEFTLYVAPFVGDAARSLTARFRYRAPKEGVLKLGYKLNRPHDVLKASLDAIVAHLRTECSWPVFIGARRS